MSSQTFAEQQFSDSKVNNFSEMRYSCTKDKAHVHISSSFSKETLTGTYKALSVSTGYLEVKIWQWMFRLGMISHSMNDSPELECLKRAIFVTAKFMSLTQ